MTLKKLLEGATVENANERFERIADEFYADTGYLRPGKSESPMAYYDGRDREREVAFEVWCKMRKKMTDHAAAFAELVEVAKARPNKFGPHYMIWMDKLGAALARLKEKEGGL